MWIEIFGTVTGLIYLILEIRQRKAMWIVGLISSLVYIYVFFTSKVYAMMGLQVYYVVISIYGFLAWSKQATDSAPSDTGIQYRRLNGKLSLWLGLVFAALFFLLYFILKNTDSVIPLGDAFTTTMGIVATWMVARRILENWYGWIIANAISSIIYFQIGLIPTMFLYICYSLLAIVGLYTWKKKGVRYDQDI